MGSRLGIMLDIRHLKHPRFALAVWHRNCIVHCSKGRVQFVVAAASRRRYAFELDGERHAAGSRDIRVRGEEVNTMPYYEYECEQCGKRFEAMQTFEERDRHEEHERHKPLTCPKCRSKKVQSLVSHVFVQTSKKS
jgi:putative FmdB family regulatory protein